MGAWEVGLAGRKDLADPAGQGVILPLLRPAARVSRPEALGCFLQRTSLGQPAATLAGVEPVGLRDVGLGVTKRFPRLKQGEI